MLIKYYDYTLSPVSDLFIIENIENVVVHGAIFQPEEMGPDINQVQNHLFYDNDVLIETDRPSKKLITFRKDGCIQRLAVYGTAYICNNDGETIEKVAPIR